MLELIEVDPKNNPEALELLNKLSASLEAITGNSGNGSFDLNDMSLPGSFFVIAKNEKGEGVGCGAIRPLSKDIAEVKRMYAKYKGEGIGSRILTYLEGKGKEAGYSALWLETRVINTGAVKFYKRNGYKVRENYGKYKGNTEAVCFEKYL